MTAGDWADFRDEVLRLENMAIEMAKSTGPASRRGKADAVAGHLHNTVSVLRDLVRELAADEFDAMRRERLQGVRNHA